MAARPILIDATRLLTRLGYRAPTGIDRVDLAYAQHFLPRSGGAGMVAESPRGTRLMPQDEAASLVGTLARRWREEGSPESDDELDRLRVWLAGSRPSSEPASGRPRVEAARVFAARRLRSLATLAWPSADAMPQGAIYLHTSHIRLDRPGYLSWLDRRPDVRPVFFVHDLIPIDYPEYAVPGEADRHRRRMEAVGRRAAAVITNSQDVADRLIRYLTAAGIAVPPVAAAQLGVEAAFSTTAAPLEAVRPYFVLCGTIEARKNHLLILQVWRELATRLADRTPALVLVGRRGWEAESALDLLDRCAAIRPHVIEVSGLSTAGLASVMAGARALLMPSFAEGYGIPIVEAMGVGARVIASDLGPHREIADGTATLLSPLDGIGWRDAILDAASSAPDTTGEAVPAPPSWCGHFATVEALLARI